MSAPQTALAPVERQAAGQAFADAHSFASTAWRQAGTASATRESILSDAADIIDRLRQLRKELGASD